MQRILAFALVLTLGLCGVALADGDCAHARTFEWIAGMIYEQWSATNHQVLYEVYVQCEDCNDIVDWYGEGFFQAHDFYGNRCEYCGYSRNNIPTYAELQAEARQRVTEDAAGIAGKQAVVIHNGNLRAAPSQDSADMGAVISDDEYEIVSCQVDADNDVWLEIRYLDGTAWVSASLARISGAEAQKGEYAEAYSGRTCKIKVSSGRARIAPGKKSPEIAYVHYQEKYVILDAQAAADGTLWFQINVDGTLCWISSGLADVY